MLGYDKPEIIFCGIIETLFVVFFSFLAVLKLFTNVPYGTWAN